MVAKTPKNDGGFPSAAMTEKISVSEKPTTRSARATPDTICRNGRVSQTWRRPAVTSWVKWCSGGAGFSSCTRMRERKKTDAAKVAESSTATAPPPSTA